MAIKKNSPEKLLEEIIKLDPVQFLGVCKILDIEIYEGDNEEAIPKEFESLWVELCDTIENLNRIRRRNLGQLLRAVNKKEKE